MPSDDLELKETGREKFFVHRGQLGSRSKKVGTFFFLAKRSIEFPDPIAIADVLVTQSAAMPRISRTAAPCVICADPWK